MLLFSESYIIYMDPDPRHARVLRRVDTRGFGRPLLRLVHVDVGRGRGRHLQVVRVFRWRLRCLRVSLGSSEAQRQALRPEPRPLIVEKVRHCGLLARRRPISGTQEGVRRPLAVPTRLPE